MNQWPGVLEPELLHPGYVSDAARLADASKAGDWSTVFGILSSCARPVVNQWRIDGRAWFTPLHQAAWLGAPVEVAEQLVTAGAWRSLRTADGHRAIDLASERGHRHLHGVLEVITPGGPEVAKYAAWDERLAELIEERTRGLPPVRFRAVPTEVIDADRLDALWFPYPGMYGGFRMRIDDDALIVESWSRVVSGWGQRHAITDAGCVLLESGLD